jgi:hypothetical protein
MNLPCTVARYRCCSGVPLFRKRDNPSLRLKGGLPEEIFSLPTRPAEDDPDKSDLYDIRCASIMRFAGLADGTVRLVEGKQRAGIARSCQAWRQAVRPACA